MPFNNRKALDRALCDGVRLVRMDALPESVQGTRAKDVDVVATPRGGSVPSRLIEVEAGGDIRGALHRCEHVLAHLRRSVRPEQLPRVTIVADASRKAAFERYVHEAPLPANGFPERCEFRSFEEVYRDALQLLPSIPPHLRAA